ncbi:glycosyltransferase family 4 protein [Gaoshiqia sediminis]|uniref:Glycosyltransferase family 4 protein n=1 Tax=Gaoshiqia sediminis TaxID=2986998 RepID=A0AA41Y4K8_9BACT|nr:glycosyltransferase family 4 protein [Gaoshiqia sediminis]MCW0483351.1 glycosyltransferase family 4 protein [Gaoshiqia sediminis]
MKVLMFGWEFPPNISGGLGTACYGLTKGLAKFSDVDVTFVVPKVFGGEDQSSMKLIGAADVPVTNRKVQLTEFDRSLEYVEVSSALVPYVDPEDYYRQTNFTVAGANSLVETDDQGKIKFTGKYGPDLLSEIDRYAVVARAIARDTEFDVIHAHDWLAYPAGIAAKEVSGKPLVIHVHATDFDRSGGSANPSVYAIEKQGMDAADKIITVSNLTRQVVIDKYGIDAEKIVTVYNAVEPYLHDESQPVTKGFDDKVVTFLGRITMQKGPEYFVEAAACVLKRMQNVRFVMAGSGDMMHRMIRRTAQLKISDKFHFTGFLKGDDVYRMLRISDVYIMPSVSEPFGISPLEAMQARVPVIISRQSGVAEILSNAIKVNFWDVDAMADAIHGILKHQTLSKMLARQGKKESYSLKWEGSAHRVKQVYQAAINMHQSN